MKRLKPLPLVMMAVALISAGPPDKKGEVPADDPKDVTAVRAICLLGNKLDGNGNLINLGIRDSDLRGNPDAASALRRLRHVEFVGIHDEADAAVDVMKEWTSLKTTDLTDVSDDGLAALERLTQPRGLRIYSRDVTDDGLRSVAKLKNLEVLTLDGAQISDAGIKHVAALPLLKKLELNRTPITDAGLAELKGMKLESLALRSTKITDQGIDALKNMGSLKLLEVHDTKVTKEVLEKLNGIPGLDVWGFRDEHVHEVADDPKEIAAIQAASDKISAIQDNRSDNVYFVGASSDRQQPRVWLKHLKGLHNLKELVLPEFITEDDDLAILVGLPVPEKLVVRHCDLSEKGLKSIGALHGLRRLDLSGCGHITAAGMAHLVGLTDLDALNFDSTPLNDDGLQPLAKLSKLEGLTLSRTKISDGGLKSLAGLTNLKYLDLGGTQTTDAGLVNLHKLKKLRLLYPGSGVTADGIRRLLEDAQDRVA
jgi:internalin A